MLNLLVKTKLPQDEVINKLKGFFGEKALGLDLKEETPACLTFEGGGGYVTATLCEDEGKTRIDLTTMEWEYHVKKFGTEIG